MLIFVNLNHIMQGLESLSKFCENSPLEAAVDSSLLIYLWQAIQRVDHLTVARCSAALQGPYPQLARGVNVSLRTSGRQPSLYRHVFDGITEIAAIATVSAFGTRMRVALRNVAMEFFPGLFIPGLIPAILHADK